MTVVDPSVMITCEGVTVTGLSSMEISLVKGASTFEYMLNRYQDDAALSALGVYSSAASCSFGNEW